MAHRGPVGIVLALGPAHRSHIGVHHRHHHLQSGAHGHRQQALANIGNDFTDRHRHRLRHRQRFYGSINRLIVLFHSGPLSFSRVDLAVAQHLAHARHQAGDRHLKIHDVRDNLEGGLDSHRGTVQRRVFSARHAGLWSGGMGTVSDDI